MDLATAVNASVGNYEATFALSDFSHTIGYSIAGGDSVLTHLLLTGAQSVGATDAFGGSTSVVELDGANLTFTADGTTLNEAMTLASDSDNVINTGAHTATLAGAISGTGGLEKTGAGILVVSGTGNTYTGGTTVAAGTLQLDGTNSLPTSGSLTVDSGASVDLNGNDQSISGIIGGNGTFEGGGSLMASGIVRPGASIGTLTVDGTAYTQASGSNLEIEFNNTGGAGNVDLITATGGGTLTVSSGARLVPVALESIAGTKTYTFMHDAAGISGSFGGITDNYAVLNFSIAKANSDQDYQLTITRATYASAQTSPVGKGVAPALDSIYTAGSVPSDLQTVMDQIDLLSVSGINDAYDALTPDSSGGANASAQMVSSQMQNVIGGRMDSLRSGFSTGDLMSAGAAWLQGFLTEADQEDRRGFSGYNATVQGFAMGVDGQANNTLRLGLSYGFGNTQSSTSDNSIDANGHIVSLYAAYEPKDWFVNGMISYGFYDYESDRSTLTGTAKGLYNGNQLAAKADVGFPLAARADTVLTPLVSLRYSRLALDGYTETGASGSNLTVQDGSYDTLTTGLGTKASTILGEEDGWLFAARGSALYAYDVLQDKVSTTSRFVSAGPSFSTGGLTPSRHAVEYGAGVVLTRAGGLDLSLDYNGEWRPDYIAHTGTFKIRQAF